MTAVPRFYSRFRMLRAQWVEIVALTACVLVLGYLADPADLLFLEHGPWLALVPLLLALRYGLLPALVSLLLLLGAWLLGAGRGWFLAAEFPAPHFLGALLLAFIGSEYHQAWYTRLRRLEQTNAYMDERLQRLTRKHQLLSISHDSLTQQFLGGPPALREILLEVRRLSVREHPRLSRVLAAKFLDVLAVHCQLEAAALYTVKANRPAAQPLAKRGSVKALHADDPLVRYGLERKCVCHIQMEALHDHNPSRYLVVAPMFGSGGGIIALLVVEHMEFFALQDENLRKLALLIGYFADLLNAGRAAKRLVTTFPECPENFAEEMTALAGLQHKAGIGSSIALWTFSGASPDDHLLLQVRTVHRQLDVLWTMIYNGRTVLIVLMPLTDQHAIEGHTIRIAEWLREQLGKTLEEANIQVHYSTLQETDPLHALKDLLSRSIPRRLATA